MAQESNPFFVQPAQMSTAPVLEGVNKVLDTTRVMNKRQRMKEGMMSAFQSGDPTKVAEFIAEYPEAQEGLSKAMGFKSQATKKNYLDTLRGVLSVNQENISPEDKQAKISSLLNQRNEYVRSQGGEPNDTEKGLEDYMADPEGFMRAAELGYAAMAPKQEVDQYNLQRGVTSSSRGMGFSGKDTFKDDEGNYFSSTEVRDNTTGEIVTSVKAMDGSDKKPVGQLQRVSSIGLTPQEIIEHEGKKTGMTAKIKRHEKAVDDLTSQLAGFDEEARLLTEAERLLETGNVSTGTIQNMFPSFGADTIQLENIGSRLGLNIIQNTTFGALSEAEMRLAMQTGFPSDMQPPELLDWTRRRKAARAKLRDELISAIRYMNSQDPNSPEYANAQANWQAMRDAQRQAEAQAAQAAQGGGAPQGGGMSDDEYQQRLNKHLQPR